MQLDPVITCRADAERKMFEKNSVITRVKHGKGQDDSNRNIDIAMLTLNKAMKKLKNAY